MKDVYVKNPQMGDPASVDPRLAELGQTIEKLQLEVQKFEVSLVPMVDLIFASVSVGIALVFGLLVTVNNEEVQTHVLSCDGSREACCPPIFGDAVQLEGENHPLNKDLHYSCK